MQDYAMARGTSGNIQSKSIGNVAFTELIRENESRSALVISPPATGHIQITINPGDATTTGIRLFSGAEPLSLTLAEHGAIVTKGFSAIHSAGTEVISVMETNLFIPQSVWQTVWRMIVGGK